MCVCVCQQCASRCVGLNSGRSGFRSAKTDFYSEQEQFLSATLTEVFTVLFPSTVRRMPKNNSQIQARPALFPRKADKFFRD